MDKLLEWFGKLYELMRENPIDFVLGVICVLWVTISVIFVLGWLGIKKIPGIGDLTPIQGIIANQYIKSLFVIAGLLSPILSFYKICPYAAVIYSPKEYAPREALFFVKRQFYQHEVDAGHNPTAADDPSYRYHLPIMTKLESPACIGTLVVSFHAACYAEGRTSGQVEIYVDGEKYKTVKMADKMSDCLNWKTFGDIKNYARIDWKLPLNTKVTDLHMEIDVGDYGLAMRNVEVRNSCSDEEKLGWYLLKRLFGRC